MKPQYKFRGAQTYGNDIEKRHEREIYLTDEQDNERTESS